jgi:predicted RND superfamily exporter protein
VGLVLVVGVGCCLFVSLVMLPAILTLVASEPGHHVEAKDDANTLATDAKSVRKRAA